MMTVRPSRVPGRCSCRPRPARSLLGRAAALGLKGRVDARRFREVLEGKVQKTDLRLGRRTGEGETEHEPGHDITFSAPKSVFLEGLLWDRDGVACA